MQPISTGHKLQELRKLMAARHLQAFLVPSEDAHQVAQLVLIALSCRVSILPIRMRVESLFPGLPGPPALLLLL